MSGNNHDDILQYFEGKEKDTVNKIIDLMKAFHPKVQINRAFQKKLKAKILSSKKKTLSWYFFLPRLSLVFTSFLILIGVWKIWGSYIFPQEQLIGQSNEQIAAIQFKEMRDTNGEAPIDQSGYYSDTISEGARMDTSPMLSEMQAQNPTSSRSSESSRQGKISTAQMSETSLSQEIANISNDIETIVADSTKNTSETAEPLGGAVVAKMSLLSTTEPPTLPQINITIDYPNRMAVYSKTSAWLPSEITTRSASGMTKSLEKTYTKNELVNFIDTTLMISTFGLEYRSAKKEGDNLYYLIPALKYVGENQKIYFTSMIPGYILD